MMAAGETGRPRRRIAAWVAGGLALLLAADTALWWAVTGRMMAAVPDAMAAAAQDGWRIEAGEPRRGGWPFRASVRLADVSAVRNLGTVRLRWTAEALDLVLGPRAPTVLAVVPQGRQTVRTGPGEGIELRADAMAVLVPLRADGPVTAQAAGLVVRGVDGRGVDGRGTDGRGTDGRGTDGRALAVARLDARFDGTALAGTAEGIVPTPAMAAPFDGAATLGLRVLVAPAFVDAGDPAASATVWQRAGGRVEVPEFSLRLASLAVEGSGGGGLDGALQPDGQATLRVQGAGAMLDAAIRAGLLPAGPATAVRAVLDLLTAAARGGPVALPVVLHDRVLTVARFPVLRVPALDWGVRP